MTLVINITCHGYLLSDVLSLIAQVSYPQEKSIDLVLVTSLSLIINMNVLCFCLTSRIAYHEGCAVTYIMMFRMAG